MRPSAKNGESPGGEPRLSMVADKTGGDYCPRRQAKSGCLIRSIARRVWKNTTASFSLRRRARSLSSSIREPADIVEKVAGPLLVTVKPVRPFDDIDLCQDSRERQGRHGEDLFEHIHFSTAHVIE